MQTVTVRVAVRSRTSTDVDAILALLCEKHSKSNFAALSEGVLVVDVIRNSVTAKPIARRVRRALKDSIFDVDGEPDHVMACVSELSTIFPEVSPLPSPEYDRVETEDMFDLGE